MLLNGKKGMILGVANKRSIAWAIAEKFHQNGARFVMTYQNERVGRNVKKLASALSDCPTVCCDVTSDDQIEGAVQFTKNLFGSIDFIIHSIAYAPPQDLKGKFSNVSREGFRIALEVSAYSLTAIVKKAFYVLHKGASIITITSGGSWRVIPTYHVMGIAKAALESSVRYLSADLGQYGIRVNGISSGPIRTISAMGIRRFSKILDTHRERSPLHRRTKPSEVADAAAYLASDLSSNVTGDILFVDSGYHVIGI